MAGYMDATYFDADYFLRGKETGRSSYSDYNWKPHLTLPMVDGLRRVLKLNDGDTVMDYGCSRGYLVKALRMRGVNAHGFDVSPWAIENCDPDVRGYVTNDPKIMEDRWDHIFCKDTLEHIPMPELTNVLQRMISSARKSVLAIVPLTYHAGGPYLRDEDNADPSHVIAWPLDVWMDFLHQHFTSDEGYLSASWHLPNLKPASSQVPRSCGFLQFHRI